MSITRKSRASDIRIFLGVDSDSRGEWLWNHFLEISRQIYECHQDQIPIDRTWDKAFYQVKDVLINKLKEACSEEPFHWGEKDLASLTQIFNRRFAQLHDTRRRGTVVNRTQLPNHKLTKPAAESALYFDPVRESADEDRNNETTQEEDDDRTANN